MAVNKRVFHDYRRWATWALAGWTVVAMAASGALAGLLGALLGVIGSLTGLILPWWALFEYGILTGNGRLRQRVASKLRAAGEVVDTGDDRFVGLAWPAHLDSSDRRWQETDDDVGFLRITPDGLTFHGDGVEFEVPADQIADVRLVNHPQAFTYWARVEVDIRDGEPMETVIFDSRDHAGHSRCRRDNRRIVEAIRALIRPSLDQIRLDAEIDAGSELQAYR